MESQTEMFKSSRLELGRTLNKLDMDGLVVEEGSERAGFISREEWYRLGARWKAAKNESDLWSIWKDMREARLSPEQRAEEEKESRRWHILNEAQKRMKAERFRALKSKFGEKESARLQRLIRQFDRFMDQIDMNSISDGYPINIIDYFMEGDLESLETKKAMIRKLMRVLCRGLDVDEETGQVTIV